MAVLKYPGAEWVPGPPNKQGYAAYPSPQSKEGFVLHSMVGGYVSAYGRLMSTDTASWHFSILKDGSVKQHYDPRAVCWHCGVVGDADTLTAAVGNVALIGIEHEGGPIGNVSEPLTQAQIDATIAVQRWCYDVLPELKPPALHQSHFEHNWLSATACPSGRFTPIWDTIITTLKEEDMPLNDNDWVKFQQMFARAAREVNVPATEPDGSGGQTPISGPHPLTEFVGSLNKHAGDAAKHSAGGPHKHAINTETTEA